MDAHLDMLVPGQLALFAPQRSDERIKAQRGEFVFARLAEGTNPNGALEPGEAWAPGSLLKEALLRHDTAGPTLPRLMRIDVPHGFKEALLKVLSESYSLNYEGMYPDVTGFARSHGADQRFRYSHGGALLDYDGSLVDPD